MIPKPRDISYEMRLRECCLNTRNQEVERKSDRSVYNTEWV